MRTFFCLPIDERLRTRIAQTSDAIRRETRMAASWVRPENYHVTVRFLGEIDALGISGLQAATRRVGCTARPFEVRVDSVGAFPSADRARVLWVGASDAAAFEAFVDALERELEGAGFPRERQPAVAHVTMARIKSRPDDRLPGILTNLNPFPAHSLRVDRVVLMESRLTPRGPEYVSLFSVPLEAAA